MLEWIFFNGVYTTKDKAVVPVNDTIIGRGYGIFDFLQARNGIPLFLEDHVARFFNSAQILGLPIAFSALDLQQAIYQLLDLNKTNSAGIKMICTGGVSADGFSVGNNQVIIYLSDYTAVPTEKFRTGVKLKLVQYQREMPEAKSINYLFPMSIAPQLKASGYEEPLYFDKWVRETARGNIFLVRNNRLYTPENGILSGVTRKHVLNVANQLLPSEQTNISIIELMSADELFLTSSIKRILPVYQVDEQIIGNGKIGPWTEKLASLLLAEEDTYIQRATKETGRILT